MDLSFGDSKPQTGEMPPKRGRGRGRGVLPSAKPSENTPLRSDNSQILGQRGRGRGKAGKSSASSEEFEKKYVLEPYQSPSHNYEHSMPSTSSVKEYHKASGDISFPPKDKESGESYRTNKYQAWKSDAAHSAKEYSKRQHEDIKSKSKQDESRRYSSESSTSAKEYPRGNEHNYERTIHKKDKRRYTSSDESSPEHPLPPVSFTSNECKINPEDIGLKFEQKSFHMSLFPQRPGYGKEGRHIQVMSNLYPIKFPTGHAYHYGVEVLETNQRKHDPGHKKYRCLNTKRNREVVSYMLNNSPVFKRVCGAFDGRNNLLTREELKIDLPFSCSVMLPSEKSNDQSDCFKVEIKSLVARINLDSINAFYKRKLRDLPQDALMAIEIILRHNPCLNFTPVYRSFYFPPDVGNITPFGGGLEIWFGYHQSIRLSQWSPTVNLDVSATTFWEAGPVLNYIADYMNMSVKNLGKIQLKRNEVRGINRKLKQRRVKVTHLSYGRKYRIVRLREVSANQEYIELKDKKGKVTRQTVAQYFKETYQKYLEFGNLPCVQVQPENKNIFMPVEVCEFVEGQHYKGELTPAQKTKMIQCTSKPPHERFRNIQDIVHDKANFKNDNIVRGFNLEIGNRPLTADARVIDSPSLMYNKEILPRNGQWDVRGTRFIEPAKISNWVLLSFQRDRNLKEFANVLSDIGKNLGLRIGEPSDILIESMKCDIENLFCNLKNRDKVELVVIVIPNVDERQEKWLYAEIKKAAETVIGLATQCVKAERLENFQRKRWPQIASNLCLKINAKLGGENHSLLQRDIPLILQKPVIIIGADVNHPAPTQLNQPSIAACVGSLDCLGKRFAVSIRAQVNSNSQKRKVEEILELEDMVKDLLLQFYKHTRKKPEKIIFYRDGVSEGELVAVKNKEVVSIRKACRKMGENYQPGITVIVVQKRHHVRFKPCKREDGCGPKGNLPPGTVIDTEVTHPVNFDFFLCSQFGLQGTSRPSHYLVVEDDNNFSADDLQKLTYQMCHMYVRCTKSISIPAPVAYADLVAYRARKHLECKRAEDSSSSDCSLSYKLSQEDIDAITVVDRLKDKMYFV